MASTPPDIGQPTREARTGREDSGQRGNKWWTLVAVCLGTFMLLLDITIVNVARPDIQQALHSSFADLQARRPDPAESPSPPRPTPPSADQRRVLGRLRTCRAWG